MQAEPDYNAYSLEELREAQESISRERFPERAARIDALVSERANQQRQEAAPVPAPVTNRGRVVGYQHRTYPIVLFASLLVLILANLYALIQGATLALLPLTLQVGVVVACASRSPWQVHVVRAWALIVFIGGMAGFVKVLANVLLVALGEPPEQADALQPAQIVQSLVLVVVATYLIYAAGKEPIFEGVADAT